MYFLSKKQHFLFGWAVHLSSLNRYLITLGSLVLIICCWWLCIYKPLENMMHTYALRNKSVHGECIARSTCQQTIQDLTNCINQSQVFLTRAAVRCHRASDWGMSVIKMAQQQGLAVQSYTTHTELNKDWYRCAVARFEFCGSCDQILAFIRTVVMAGNCIGCKHWTLERHTNNKYALSCLLYALMLDAQHVSLKEKPLQLE